MNSTLKRKFIVLFAVLAVACWAPAALADTFLLSAPNLALTGYPGPYVKVDITVSGGNALFTYTGLTQDGFTYWLGDSHLANFNTNNTVSSLTSFLPAGASDTGSWNGGSDFGYMSNTTKFDQGANPAPSFSFTANDTFANVADVLTLNADGFFLSAHVFVFPSTSPGVGDALTTGFVGTGTPGGGFVPVPPTAWLLGSGLVGLLLLGRRRKKG
jgi:hypothetical protein